MIKVKVKSQSEKSKSVRIDIDHLAKLANLPLTAQEKKTFKKQLTDVLSYISKLNELDTTRVEPIGHITGLENVTRDDETAPSLTRDKVLSSTSRKYNGFFQVKAIFEEQ